MIGSAYSRGSRERPSWAGGMELLHSWNGDRRFTSWSEYMLEAATGVMNESRRSKVAKEVKGAWPLELCLNAPLDCWTVIVAEVGDGEVEPAAVVWVLAAAGVITIAVPDAPLDCWTGMDVCGEGAEPCLVGDGATLVNTDPPNDCAAAVGERSVYCFGLLTWS